VNNTRDEKRLKEFGAHFCAIRKAKKFTQKSLAFEADVEISQIYRIEKGLSNPTVTTLMNLADALQISVAEFFEFKISRSKR